MVGLGVDVVFNILLDLVDVVAPGVLGLNACIHPQHHSHINVDMLDGMDPLNKVLTTILIYRSTPVLASKMVRA
jgi:hypothetical protein